MPVNWKGSEGYDPGVEGRLGFFLPKQRAEHFRQARLNMPFESRIALLLLES